MKLLGTEKKQPLLGLPVSPLINLHERIDRQAYELYEVEGCVTGDDFDHWLERKGRS